MKQKYTRFALFLGMAALLATSCQKDVEPGYVIEAYTVDSFDPNGGLWDPILIQPSDIPGMLAAPAQTNSAEYQAELDEMKMLLKAVTPDQQKLISKWNGNALARWNEIARELVAKYNLPPAANPDGTYPVPDAANPSKYPLFPFANPPYASRMYAYWGAGQFDALIAAWSLKSLHNRPAPYVVDAGIQPLLQKNPLPSYPSEDAVIAAVSREILSFMFPLEKEHLASLAQEHMDTRVWSGMNVKSDLTAGDQLGKTIATFFINRAKSDGMKFAGGNQTQWDSLSNAAQTKYGWHWESLETPKRPPMLPFFGRVKPWCIPSVAAVRPLAPPSLDSEEFKKAKEELESLSKKLTVEQRKIANYWGDGVSTYTPPGHWNRVASDLVVKYRMNLLRTARVYAYMNMSLMDAAISCWDTKYYYHYPRPSQVIPGFKSYLGLPNFPSYTSGHSTFSGAAATVLGHIFPSEAAEMIRQAKEASESRIYGGIHYRFDCEVGLETGNTIGNYSVVVAQVDGAE